MRVWNPEDKSCEHMWDPGDESGIGTRVEVCWRCRSVRPTDPERDEVAVRAIRPPGDPEQFVILVSPKPDR